LIDLRPIDVTQALEALPETTAEKQLEPATKSLPSSNRKSILLLSLFALILNGGAAIYTLPSFDIAMPDFSGMVAELLPHASVPIPDPIVTAALKDIQSTHQQYLAALQESGSTLQQNTVLLLRGATALDSLKQGVSSQQSDVKKLSAQLSVLTTKVDTLQNAVTPETTGSISQMRARNRGSATARRKSISRLPKPAGPVSVGGAPLSSLMPAWAVAQRPDSPTY
jgi:hypothetical protein